MFLEHHYSSQYCLPSQEVETEKAARLAGHTVWSVVTWSPLNSRLKGSEEGAVLPNFLAHLLKIKETVQRKD
ncbi:hypothetical protein GN956_G13682 [Arapaima gigas]